MNNFGFVLSDALIGLLAALLYSTFFGFLFGFFRFAVFGFVERKE